MTVNIPLELTVSTEYMPQVARAVVNVILFHRILTLTQPECGVALGTTYCKLGNDAIRKNIDDKLNGIAYPFSVDFLDLSPPSWFGRESAWESWQISIKPDTQPHGGRERSRKQLVQALMYISQETSLKKDHLPALSTVPFPYDIKAR